MPESIAKSWLWPDRAITPIQSAKLRAEHNAVVNSHADLLDELKKNREQLVELRDKHLNHTAAVVRALVQKRIEAADIAIRNAEVIHA